MATVSRVLHDKPGIAQATKGAKEDHQAPLWEYAGTRGLETLARRNA